MDLAEPLISFDSQTDAAELRQFMTDRNLKVVGMRAGGIVTGLMEQNLLPDAGVAGPGRCTSEMTILPSTASLAETVLVLREHQRVLVSVLGQAAAIVSRTDLQKPAARMWLFGMVTLIEMRYSTLVERFCPGDAWRPFLSDARILMAEHLMQERQRRNLEVDLLSCLQFSDKAQIVARNADLRAKTRFESRRQVEQTAKALQKLRNNLAHSQDIVTDDWNTIVLLTENLESVLEGPPGLDPDDQRQ
jgi:hypothetical protein